MAARNVRQWAFRIEHLIKLKNEVVAPGEKVHIVGGQNSDAKRVYFIISKEVNTADFSRMDKRTYFATKEELIQLLRNKGETLPPDDYIMQVDVKDRLLATRFKVVKIAKRSDLGKT